MSRQIEVSISDKGAASTPCCEFGLSMVVSSVDSNERKIFERNTGTECFQALRRREASRESQRRKCEPGNHPEQLSQGITLVQSEGKQRKSLLESLCAGCP